MNGAADTVACAVADAVADAADAVADGTDGAPPALRLLAARPARPALPAGGADATDGASAAANGPALRLDQLGPMVVNRDGTLARIENWAALTEQEKRRIERVLVQRNRQRLARLARLAELAPHAPSQPQGVGFVVDFMIKKMGRGEGNSPAAVDDKGSAEQGSLSIYLASHGLLGSRAEQSLPSSFQLLALKKDLKEVLENIETKQEVLEREWQEVQEKYKGWLFSEQKGEVDRGEETALRSVDGFVQEEVSASYGWVIAFSTPYCESFKDALEYQELSDEPCPRKEYVYDEILNISDPQELKRQLGVSYFPTVDLSDQLPGAAVDEDFSKVKAPVQVSISTYYAYLDPFYRPFSEEDLAFLNEKEEELTTYMIPPLGIFSENGWASEDISSTVSSGFNPLSSLPYGSPSQLTDEHLFTEEISCGPLLERLLSAILKEENVSDDEQKADDNEKNPELYSPGWKIPMIKADYHTFEERLKKELRYIGILGNDDIDWNNREDDEISSNLRSLQSQLRRQCAINSARKNKLSELIKDHLAYQEYSIILNDLNKQVEQAFLKRSKNIEAKKKKTVGYTNSVDCGSGKPGLNNHIHALLERRKKWIEKVGSIFTPIEKYTRLPTDTIYDNLDNIKINENINKNEI
ncbi:hypothetical protein PORY_000867 [Pneumocystis oryctolagi]|uniref:Uncharacterized protein n=1 Tax=Pneumocystis oryctolagi TaxID=42067 RepID=A0ACB7CDW6_9ASCO|nr:hypothetical protein PORY_000867 [Pneumocystis oryctolagi]